MQREEGQRRDDRKEELQLISSMRTWSMTACVRLLPLSPENQEMLLHGETARLRTEAG